MKIFTIEREEKIAAVGIEFDNGMCAVAWNGSCSSVAVYQDLRSAVAVHGHNGKLEQRASFTIDNVEQLRMNFVQDLAEIQGCVLMSNDKTLKYLWEEREMLANIFHREQLP